MLIDLVCESNEFTCELCYDAEWHIANYCNAEFDSLFARFICDVVNVLHDLRVRWMVSKNPPRQM
jgi:hypothetical protein